MNDTEILVTIFLCILLPVLILVVAVFVMYYGIQNAEQQEEKPMPSKTSCCKLHRQFWDMDIILSRYECISTQDIDFFDYDIYHMFKLEINSVFDTPEEKKNFFKKYPSMKERYEKVNHVLFMML